MGFGIQVIEVVGVGGSGVWFVGDYDFEIFNYGL